MPLLEIRKMISSTSQTPLCLDPLDLFVFKMRAEGMGNDIIDIFSHHYCKILQGEDGILRESDLRPVPKKQIALYEDLDGFAVFGRSLLHRSARIVLNGGLGTTMGLSSPKSLVAAKNEQTFMDIILSEAVRKNITLCLMNSMSTHEETCRHTDSRTTGARPLMFFQHAFPKILQESLMPAYWPEDTALEWNPAGHGDVYNSLYISGMLDKLLDLGIHYAFISNSDNLGASLDPALLGYFAQARLPFMMEVAHRSHSDAKGGHLAKNAAGGLVLRETAQCRPEDTACFQDIDRYRFFNTNNIWINLLRLKKRIQRDGFIRLPMLLNPKHLNPKDESSPWVYQVETAMGAAISLFKGAAAVCVPRTRFFPVKSTNDLMVLRSDRFSLTPDEGLRLSPDLEESHIHVDLDPRFYRRLDQFEERFAGGVPGLASCSRLTIRGNVYFEKAVTIRGRVTISAKDRSPRVIQSGAVIDSDIEL